MWSKMEWIFARLSIVLGFRAPLGSLAGSHLVLLSHQPAAAKRNCLVQLIFYVVCIETLLHNLFSGFEICRLSLHFLPPRVWGNEFLWLFAVFCTLWEDECCLLDWMWSVCMPIYKTVYFLIAFFPRTSSFFFLMPLENDYAVVKHPQRPNYPFYTFNCISPWNHNRRPHAEICPFIHLYLSALCCGLSTVSCIMLHKKRWRDYG